MVNIRLWNEIQMDAYDDDDDLNPADALMDAMDRHAAPQQVESIMAGIMDDVWNRDNGDGWFDIVGVVGGVPFLVIRYQWWESGWHYRLINPRMEHHYKMMD